MFSILLLLLITMPKKTKIKIRGKQSVLSTGHLITSRPPRSPDRLFVMLAFIFLVMMTLMSAYALIIVPFSPGFWATFVFFVGLLNFLLMYEQNIFPNLDRSKIVYFFIAWFLLFLTVPYILLTALTLNASLLVLVLILLAIFTPVIIRLILTQTQWFEFKKKTKESVKSNISKLKPGNKKKTTRGNVTGQNRRRKIYRR